MSTTAQERAASESESEEPLKAIIDEAIASAEGGDVRLKEMLGAWGDRSYGPLFIILGLFAGTPLAVVPMAAAIVGLVIAGIAVQMAFGKTYPWMPRFILEWSVDEDRVKKARQKTAPALSVLDNLFTERLSFATGPIVRRIAAFIVACLGLVMAPMDAIPFLVAAPAWTVVLFGVGITARDGLIMIIAIAACLGVAGLIVAAL